MTWSDLDMAQVFTRIDRTLTSVGAQRLHAMLRCPQIDLDAIEPGRVGVRESIMGRMSRHGGRAEVHTAAGEGTEVVIEVGRDPSRDPSREKAP